MHSNTFNLYLCEMLGDTGGSVFHLMCFEN
jgi:hypothetical protein